MAGVGLSYVLQSILFEVEFRIPGRHSHFPFHISPSLPSHPIARIRLRPISPLPAIHAPPRIHPQPPTPRDSPPPSHILPSSQQSRANPHPSSLASSCTIPIIFTQAHVHENRARVLYLDKHRPRRSMWLQHPHAETLPSLISFPSYTRTRAHKYDIGTLDTHRARHIPSSCPPPSRSPVHLKAGAGGGR